MNDQELRRLLEQLHREIEQADTVDEKGQELLRHLGSDIRELLARLESERVQSHPSIVRRLEDAIDHFEVTHPALTAALSHMLTTLSNAGV